MRIYFLFLISAFSFLATVSGQELEKAYISDYPKTFCANQAYNSLVFKYRDVGGDNQLTGWNGFDFIVEPKEACVSEIYGSPRDITGTASVLIAPGYEGEITVQIFGKQYNDHGILASELSDPVTIYVNGSIPDLVGNASIAPAVFENTSTTLEITDASYYTFSSYVYQSGNLVENITIDNHDANRNIYTHEFLTTTKKGDYSIFIRGENACGTSSNMHNLPITVVATPNTPTGESTAVSGTQYTYTVGNSNSSVSYDWEFASPSRTAKIDNNGNSSEITVRYSSSSDASGSLRVRGKIGNEYSNWSNWKSVTIKAPIPLPVLSGPTSVCKGDADIEYTYEISSSSASAFEWEISNGSGVSIVPSGRKATMVVSENVSNTFTIRARQQHYGVWSDWKSQEINATNNINIDFSGINSCYGQGIIPLTGIQPSNGSIYLDVHKQIDIFTPNMYQVNTSNGDIKSAVTSEYLGKYYDNVYEIAFDLYNIPKKTNYKRILLKANLSGNSGGRNINNCLLSFVNVDETFPLGTWSNMLSWATSWAERKYHISTLGDYNLSTDPNKLILDITEFVQTRRIADKDVLLIEVLASNYDDGAFTISNATVETEYYPSTTINTNTVGGVYSFEYKILDARCSGTTSGSVTILPLPTATATNVSVCSGALPLVLTSGTSNASQVEYISEKVTNSNSFFTEQAGTYPIVFRATSTNGCVKEATTNVTVLQQRTASINSVEEICENTVLNLSTDCSLQNIRWYIDGSLISTNCTATYSPDGPGVLDVELEYSNANGCTNATTKKIIVRTTPGVTLDDRAECLNSVVAIYPDRISTNGANSLDYRWSTGATTESMYIVASQSQEISLTVTNEYNCSATDNAQVSILPLPVVNLTGDESVCRGETIDLEAIPFIPTHKYNWSRSVGGNGNTFRLSENYYSNGSNTFYAYVTAENGCTGTAEQTVMVHQNPSPNLLDQSACQGDIVSITTDPNFSSYLWSNGSIGTNSIYVTASSTTNYSCTVTDNNGCQGTETMGLTVNYPTVFSLEQINDESEFCYGSSVQLFGPENQDSYRWDNGATGRVKTFNIYGNGTHTLTAINQYGCEHTDDIYVFSRTLPMASVNNTTICLGETATLTASPITHERYTWDNGSSGYQIGVEPVVNTTYTVRVEDEIGCSNEYSANVTVNPVPQFTIPDQIVCEGDRASITVNGGPFLSYVWNTGETTSSILVTAVEDDTYSCSVSNAYGCQNTSQMNLRVNVPMELSLDDVDACEGEMVTLSASGDFDDYFWSTGEKTKSISVIADATRAYTLEVVDYNGCTNNESMAVFANPYPIIEIADFGINEGETTRIQGPQGDYSYLWNTGQMADYIEVSPTETTDYWVQVTSSKGCSGMDSVTVFIYDLPEIVLEDRTVCLGQSVTLEVPEGDFDSYQWSTGDNTRSIIVSPAEPTVYTVLVTNSTGGKGGSQAIIDVKPLPRVEKNDTSICLGGSALLATYSDDSYTYQWSTGSTYPTTEVSPVSTTEYEVLVLNSHGCSNRVSNRVTVEAPSADFTVSRNNIEFGGPVQYLVSNPQDIDSLYQWDFGDTYTSTEFKPTHNYYTTGYHDVSLVIASKMGCTDKLVREDYVFVAAEGTGNTSLSNTTKTGILIYPTKVNSDLYVDTRAYDMDNEIKIRLFNSIGSEVYSGHINPGVVDVLQVDELTLGVYLVLLDVNGIVSEFKIIKE